MLIIDVLYAVYNVCLFLIGAIERGTQIALAFQAP